MIRIGGLAAVVLGVLFVTTGAPARAQEPVPMLGEIRFFAGNFAPRDWAFCDGQLLPISQNPSLFALLGTTYGGDGRTSFALPDMRGRTLVHAGNGPGLPRVKQGQRASAAGEGTNGANYVAVRCIIALKGHFPSRN